MTTSDDEHRTTDWRTAALLIAPTVLVGALVAHPYIEERLPNDDAVAAEVAAGTMLWGAVHLAAAVASALIILAFLAVRSYLHHAGEDRLSPVGLPFVTVGSTLFAVLPGMEFVPLAAAETGATTAEIAAAQNAITGWFTPVLLASALTFSIGALLFAAAISKVRIGSGRLTRVVVGRWWSWPSPGSSPSRPRSSTYRVSPLSLPCGRWRTRCDAGECHPRRD